ncbi:MAG TPA: hypothetical protein VGV38_03590 [Pyrinomonadaceae bacterium]|nr:hypothetical protein [Pyrinomonadaceae bacterium]
MLRMLAAFMHGEGLLIGWLLRAALLLLVIIAGLWLIIRYLRGR